MKSRILCVLLVLLLSVSATACSGSNNNSGPNSSNAGNDISGISISSSPSPSPQSQTGNTTTDAGIPTSSSLPSPSPESQNGNTATGVPADSSNSALEAYQAVLQNSTEFFSIDNKKKLLLDDFLVNKELYEVVFKITRFAVLDMDGDGIPEVILELAVNGDPQFFEILHHMDGEVYGYNLVYRALEGLKEDGTFQYSSGAADNGYANLKFQPDAYATDILGYMKPGQDNGISYFLNNEPVTKESYDAFMKKQEGKQDAAWHEFSQTNIQAELSANP